MKAQLISVPPPGSDLIRSIAPIIRARYCMILMPIPAAFAVSLIPQPLSRMDRETVPFLLRSWMVIWGALAGSGGGGRDVLAMDTKM